MRFLVYRVATPGWRIERNVYRDVVTDSGVGQTIGWAVVTGHWCWSWQFRRPW